jgi:hypothetical protein
LSSRRSCSSNSSGSRGKRLPLERLAEAGHQLVAVPLSRRVFQQRRAADEIVLPPPGRQAAHEPLKNVPLGHRLPVERRVAKQLQHGGAVVFAMPLKHQPALHGDERIIDIGVAAEQLGSQAKRLVTRKANRRAGNLRAHLGVPLALSQAANRVEKTSGQFALVATQPDGPGTDVRVRMLQQPGGGCIVEPADLVQRPQSVQRGPAGFGFDPFSQLVRCCLIGALAQQAHGSLPVPLVWVRQKVG